MKQNYDNIIFLSWSTFLSLTPVSWIFLVSELWSRTSPSSHLCFPFWFFWSSFSICFCPYGSLTYMFLTLLFLHRVYLGFQNSSGCSLFTICMFLVRFLILLREFLGFIWSAYLRVLIRACLVSRC